MSEKVALTTFETCSGNSSFAVVRK
jgi:hypothetical protein